jgi:hypothetical protein
MPVSRILGVMATGAVVALTAGYLMVRNDGRVAAPPGQEMDHHAASRTGDSVASPAGHAGAHAAMHADARAIADAGAAASPAGQGGQTISILRFQGNETPPDVHRLRKNDRVTFRIVTPYTGTLAIHGYPGDVAIVADRELVLPVTLAHSGRFPMHIHVGDGRHIEVAVLEILPD